ncbi:unnamed protein product [Caenorhabditis angaria]|uniref:Uncharacterized protein n=1 Tax=Caenorhabditis angaria TaxID=860376 RepID=A0A9P1ISJ3_9PELO|nr:unnamed protein product [Caenorhabditis angaria]
MNVTQKLEELMLSIEGICAIFATDYDGVIVVQVGDVPRSKTNTNWLITAHLNVIGQIPKLLMGDHQSSFFQFDSVQAAVHSIDEYFFYVLAGNVTPTGAILNIRDQLLPISNYLTKICPPVERIPDDDVMSYM